jgi:predicted NACHT family NTPase
MSNTQPKDPRELLKMRERAELIKEAGLQDNKLIQGLFKLSCAPLLGMAQRAGRRLDPRLVDAAALQRVMAPNYTPPIDFPPEQGIILGYHVETGAPVMIHRNRLTENLLVIGAVGSGKTNFLFWIIDQLVRQRVHVVFYDFKGESPRLLNAYD